MKEPTAPGAGASGGREGEPHPAAGVANDPSIGGGAGAGGGVNAGSATSLDAEQVAPAGLMVTARPGGCGVLRATSLTLKSGDRGVELFAALENVGDSPACGAAFSVELFDAAEQSLAAGVGGLLVERFYGLADGTDTVAACLAPGDKTMIALSELAPDVAPEDVSRVEYWCNYWALSVVPLGRLEVKDVRSDGMGYTGALENELGRSLPEPAIAIFALDAAGRPVGVTRAERGVELPAGQTWQFQTNAAGDVGVSQAAFPTRGP